MSDDNRNSYEIPAASGTQLDPLATALAAQLAHSLGIRRPASAGPAIPLPQRSSWPVGQVSDLEVPHAAGSVPIRVYRSDNAATLPSLVYMHGGGWFSGDLESVDANCRELSARARCVVISVDYSLSPVNKFPRALEEVEAVCRWVRDNGNGIGCGGAAMAIGGESAGATLAAAACLLAREHGEPSFAFQLLIYPMLNARPEPDAMADNQDPILSSGFVRSMWRNYTACEAERDNPLVAPSRAESLAGLPPSMVITAGTDPLHAEGADFAAALDAAGVSVQYRHYPGLFHGFFGLPHPRAEAAMSDVVAALLRALH